MQVLAPALGEPVMFQVAAAVERAALSLGLGGSVRARERRERRGSFAERRCQVNPDAPSKLSSA